MRKPHGIKTWSKQLDYNRRFDLFIRNWAPKEKKKNTVSKTMFFLEKKKETAFNDPADQHDVLSFSATRNVRAALSVSDPYLSSCGPSPLYIVIYNFLKNKKKILQKE